MVQDGICFFNHRLQVILRLSTSILLGSLLPLLAPVFGLPGIEILGGHGEYFIALLPRLALLVLFILRRLVDLWQALLLIFRRVYVERIVFCESFSAVLQVLQRNIHAAVSLLIVDDILNRQALLDPVEVFGVKLVIVEGFEGRLFLEMYTLT